MKNILIGLLFVVPALAQTENRQEIAERLADELFAQRQDDLNYESLYENLLQQLSQPLDLNTATREQLQSLMLLSDQQIEAILAYRDQTGPLLSLYELQTIPSLDRETFYRIQSFLVISDPKSALNKALFQRIAHENNNYLLVRWQRTLETRAGYQSRDTARRYLGSPDKLFFRYRVSSSNDFSLGVTGEKDAGEPLQWNPSMRYYGVDYWSAHLQVQNKGHISNLILGDYQAQFGQGLVLGSVFGFGKNAETIATTRRSTLGFVPYTSLNENQLLRGIATTLRVNRFLQVHMFYSRLRHDAHPADSSTDAAITSLISSGQHRTTVELITRKAMQQVTWGSILSFRSQRLEAGVLTQYTGFDRPYTPAPTPYNQFAFRGSELRQVSAYFSGTWGPATLFGEAAQAEGGGHAITVGALMSLPGNLEISFLLRSFDRNFHTMSANAFAESTNPQNEQGLYTGLKYRVSRRIAISSFIDVYRFPWLHFRAYAPGEGYEWLVRVTAQPSRQVTLIGQLREETKPRNGDAAPVYHTTSTTRHTMLLSANYQPTPALALKTRIQASRFMQSGKVTTGIAMAQDIRLRIRKWTFTLRHALFDTDDFDNRQYLYESDVWLAFSFPALYGTGIRNVVMVQYPISEQVDCWLRWSGSFYDHQDSIGSGTDGIADNSQNDLKFQLRIRF
ncbi:MAG TPA: helix-hairpin-helix domain-containing protein [Cyclobacteriaceae bacterium]|nr:helix-hairpin-helix domain-containing protein [Cyclobacteriaceae bacterium]